MLFVCMANATFKNKVAFAFLQEIRKRFRERYSNEEILHAKDFDMSASFADTFKTQVVPLASRRCSSTATRARTRRTCSCANSTASRRSCPKTSRKCCRIRKRWNSSSRRPPNSTASPTKSRRMYPSPNLGQQDEEGCFLEAQQVQARHRAHGCLRGRCCFHHHLTLIYMGLFSNIHYQLSKHHLNLYH